MLRALFVWLTVVLERGLCCVGADSISSGEGGDMNSTPTLVSRFGVVGCGGVHTPVCK